MKFQTFLLAACAVALHGSHVIAAVSAEEARQLGSTLTPFGAEKGANADGSIPAYSDAKLAIPRAFKAGSGQYVDPFPEEKPLFSIDAKNMAQYGDAVPEGVKGLMSRFPSFRADIYKSHRTQRYSGWELQQIAKNATRSKMVGEGDGVEGNYGPVPFPLPKNGYEVLWNHFLRPQTPSQTWRAWSYLVDASGAPVLIGDLSLQSINLYADEKEETIVGPYKQKSLIRYNGPASQVGRQTMIIYSKDYSKAAQLYYSYSTGQRRVRVAPEFAYDTPAPTYGGAIVYDEISMYEGRPDRFDFKLVGKKEVFVPYNTNKLHNTALKVSDVFGKDHVNPDHLRWEKHRVWVLEATLKAGKRHIYSKRRFYVDEDSWTIVVSEAYDQSGKLYRVGLNSLFLTYDQASSTWSNPFIVYDLIKNNYVMSNWLGGDSRAFLRSENKMMDQSGFTPEAMQAAGVR